MSLSTKNYERIGVAACQRGLEWAKFHLEIAEYRRCFVRQPELQAGKIALEHTRQKYSIALVDNASNNPLILM